MAPRRIPLFLLNTVLYPGQPLPLHVFEPRYQALVRDCLDRDGRFGVCLIRSGQEVGGPADPHPVGTTCRILSTRALGGGRMELLTMGEERFRILRLFHDAPYLEAEIELLPEEEPGELGDLPRRAHEAASRFVHRMLNLSEDEVPELTIPDEPRALSYTLGALVPAPLQDRQALLELSVIAERLERELVSLDRVTQELDRPGEELVAVPLRFDPSKLNLN
jgi:uncharacterized protein